ncbi:hypothetical protein MNBD_ALPHA02-984 [hydrothermal vent metagenome]|uniref:Uncharacterized protein n=1 Tax=hydrothermal vent metagenome TaxID=652676 RepID=A0A3B0RCQ3_9ZZZZ
MTSRSKNFQIVCHLIEDVLYRVVVIYSLRTTVLKLGRSNIDAIAAVIDRL